MGFTFFLNLLLEGLLHKSFFPGEFQVTVGGWEGEVVVFTVGVEMLKRRVSVVTAYGFNIYPTKCCLPELCVVLVVGLHSQQSP